MKWVNENVMIEKEDCDTRSVYKMLSNSACISMKRMS